MGTENKPMPPTPKSTWDEIERVMHAVGGDVGIAAEKLGLHFSTLYRKLKAKGRNDLGVYRHRETTFDSEGSSTVTTVGSSVARIEVSHISHNARESASPESFACHSLPSDPSLSGMMHTATAPDELDGRKSTTAKLTDRALQAEIQQIRLTYQAKVGREFTNSDILAKLLRLTIADGRAKLLNGEAGGQQ